MIYHLSAPPGMSINDFIDPACFSLHYCSIDAAIKMVNTLGQNALMGKIDLKMRLGRYLFAGKTGTSWEFTGRASGS